jgi:hypothetical protein
LETRPNADLTEVASRPRWGVSLLQVTWLLVTAGIVAAIAALVSVQAFK